MRLWPPREYFRANINSPFDAAIRQTLRYANRGGDDLCQRRARRYTAAFIEPMECLPVPRVPEPAECTYEIKLDGYRFEVVRSGHLAE